MRPVERNLDLFFAGFAHLMAAKRSRDYHAKVTVGRLFHRRCFSFRQS
jgi:hypothetical protein